MTHRIPDQPWGQAPFWAIEDAGDMAIQGATDWTVNEAVGMDVYGVMYRAMNWTVNEAVARAMDGLVRDT